MLLSVVRHMFHGSFGTQNLTVTLIFEFDPRKGQLGVKIGQIGSNFKIQNFLTKTCLSCGNLSQDSKNVIYFCVRQLEIPKSVFRKCDVSTFTCFFGHCTAKNKDIALKFCMPVVCMYLDHIYSGFLDNLKISDFIGNYFWKIEILNFGGQNRKISKIRDSHFVERSILRRLAFFDCVLLQNWTF